MDAGTDGVRTAYFFVVQGGAQYQMLALGKAELLFQIRGHAEGDGYRIAGFLAYVRDFQQMKTAHNFFTLVSSGRLAVGLTPGKAAVGLSRCRALALRVAS